VPPYRDAAAKLTDAGRYRRDEAIPWPVLADDLAGSVHQVYGGLADPTYLIDADGRVAFYNMWTHAPTLHRALVELTAQGGRGIVGEGIHRAAHAGPALTDGWRGLRRGLPQSELDLETAVPGSGAAIWAGYRLRPLLAPLTLRAEPLSPPPAARWLGLAASAALGFALARRDGGAGAARRRLATP
jgi:hypothetical protein